MSESTYPSQEETLITSGEIRQLQQLKAALDDFVPTADNINRLPQKIRDYIHALETRCDPAGDVAALVLTKDQNRQLVTENAMLRRELGEKIPFMPKQVGDEIRKLQAIITSSLATNGQFRSDVCFAAFGHRDALTDEQIIDSLKALREQCGLTAEILRLVRDYRCQHCLGNPMTTDHDQLCKSLSALTGHRHF